MPHAFTGQPTEILILGSAHLNSTTPDAALLPTLERLKAWRPDLVGVEILAGEVVELYESQGGWLHELKHGGFPLARQLGPKARQLLGLTRAEAMRLAATQTQPKQKVLAYLAANEPWNALLHWSPEQELPAELGAAMQELSQHPSESVRLGVALAKALGHQKLCLFDDFPLPSMDEERWQAYMQGGEAPEFKAWLEAHPFMVHIEEAQQKSEQAGDYWVFLRDMNTPAAVAEHVDLEDGANLRLGMAGRAKQADWDARNLFMAGRVRVGLLDHLGGRVLIVVGHGHKGPMETALRALGPDVRLVDLAELDA
ncbi:hypothetical protein Dxin01_01892 [Deinococcus xinjiangensis]|uniref:GumN family protein n=1 Tax=Deinococcus xinjiangensis TaxID=457454 RepID=A0ABP9VA55_9DEIO